MEENHEIELAWQVIENTGTHLFLTGKAGTGKTTFLRRLKELTPKRMVVVAPTGIAAINAGGVTIHSFFQLNFAPYIPESTFNSAQQGFHKFGKEKINIIRSMDLLVIDEISMVRADQLDAIDAVLRRYRDRSKPFGGVQLLMIGDLQQLAPVVKEEDWSLLSSYYDTAFFFGSHSLKETEYITIELKKVYRQSDTEFVGLLNKIREKEADDAVLEELNKRYLPGFRPREEEGYIRLTTHNYQAQQYNDRQLLSLSGRAFSFQAKVEGTFPESAYPADEMLTVKEGAQIMFIKNDSSGEHRYYNGMIGLVTAVSKDGIRVKGNGESQDFLLETEEWTNSKYSLNPQTKEITEEVEGTFRQYPIRLAWAITIHKSQGLTFSRVVVDFTGGVFAGGQAYVALSRCTSLDGIQLKKQITRGDIFVRPEIVSFAQRFNNRPAIEKALKQAQADVQYVEAVKQFDQGNFEGFLEQFFLAIHSRYDIEKPVIKRFIRKKLEIINRQKKENQRLREQLYVQRKNLEKYAREYYLMGNECITQAHDSRAAIANYDKAIELNPSYTDAWIRKGITLYNNKEYYEAEVCLNEAVRLSPMLFKAVYNRGKNRMALDNIEGALADFDRAVSIKPEHAKVHELFGDALMRTGKEEEAALQWAIAERLREKNAKD